MQRWKQAVVIGSLSAGALLLLKRHRPAGVAAATVGLAVLATEYPETFEQIWENAPEYVARGTQIFSTLSRIAERFAEHAAERGVGGALREMSSEYMG